MMTNRLAAILFVLATGGATASGAAATVATPETVAKVIANAAPGDTVTLAPGTYDPVTIRDRHWSPPVTVDASAAQLRGVWVAGVSGLTWHGGTFDGGDVERNGIAVQHADHLVLDGATFHHYLRNGIGAGHLEDSRITNNVISNSGSDGIDVALSQRVVIDHNRCTEFKATPGAHADCIQIWSKPTDPPTADIVITNNEAIGDMQGFSAFSGAIDGGFDRITMEHNHAKVSAYHGLALYNCRHCVVRHNRVESLPNREHPATRAWIKVVGGEDVINCDNIAADLPKFPGRERCRDEP